MSIHVPGHPDFDPEADYKAWLEAEIAKAKKANVKPQKRVDGLEEVRAQEEARGRPSPGYSRNKLGVPTTKENELNMLFKKKKTDIAGDIVDALKELENPEPVISIPVTEALEKRYLDMFKSTPKEGRAATLLEKRNLGNAPAVFDRGK